MNCEQTQQLWDRRLDGEMSGNEREAFDRHIVECPTCSEKWRREAIFFQAIRETPGDLDDPFHAADFAEQTLDRWHRTARPSVIGRIARWSAIAASLLIVGSVAIVAINGPNQDTPSSVSIKTDKPGVTKQQPVVIAKVDTPSADDEATDPVSVLVLDVNKQISDQPSQIRQTVRDTASLLSLKQFVGMFGAKPARPVEKSDQPG